MVFETHRAYWLIVKYLCRIVFAKLLTMFYCGVGLALPEFPKPRRSLTGIELANGYQGQGGPSFSGDWATSSGIITPRPGPQAEGAYTRFLSRLAVSCSRPNTDCLRMAVPECQRIACSPPKTSYHGPEVVKHHFRLTSDLSTSKSESETLARAVE